MIKLYIENREIELSNEVTIALNKQFEDITNPSTIINSWSKTVSIPFTTRNNNTFGHIYNPDKVITNGSGMGVNFNPLKKLDFRLEWDNAILMTGYAKMNEIKQTNGKGTYEITLYGELGKIFSEMQKVTFDTSSEDTQYIIKGSDYVDETMSKELIADSWLSGGQAEYELKKKSEAGYNVNDIIGFAPNNSFSENFDYKTYQYAETHSTTFEETLGDTFEQATGIDAGNVIPDGLLPREIGEYRSYLQLPFIYWNKLFDIFIDKVKSVTGYDVNFDSNWFNEDNPYWSKLVYMLKPFSTKDGIVYSNTYRIDDMTVMTGITYASAGAIGYTPSISNDSYHNLGFADLGVVSEGYPIYDGSALRLWRKQMLMIKDIPMVMEFKNSREKYSTATKQYYFRIQVPYIIEIELYDDYDEVIPDSKKVIAVTWEGNPTATEENLRAIGADAWAFTPADIYCNWQETKTVNFTIPYYKTMFYGNGTHYKIQMRGKWRSTTEITGFAGKVNLSDSYDAAYAAPITFGINTNGALNVDLTNRITRSGVDFTLNDLWNNDYNLFDEIIKYCKMYRIGVFVDEAKKKIDFKMLSTYFNSFTVKDWSNKLDKAKDFTVTPITFENKYVLFNYDDTETKLGEDYREKYGVNYGEYRLITDYNFNDETNNLFEGIKTSLVNTDNVFNWNKAINEHKIEYSLPNEIYVYTKDENNKFVDCFGQYYFHNGNKSFNTESTLDMRDVSISDDTEFQVANNTFFYTQDGGEMVQVYNYPYLDIVNGNNICLFNVPKESYTYRNNYTNKESIYSNLWADYIDERYNVQNKIVTCYLKLKPYDYINFDFNHFIKMGNQLYMLNKIYDYDVSSNESTKVDLITIQDISAYSHTDYTYDYLRLSNTNLTIPNDGYKVIKVTSTLPWNVNYGDWTDYNTIFPDSGNSGSTIVYVGNTGEVGNSFIDFYCTEEGTQEMILSKTLHTNVGGNIQMTPATWYNTVTQGSSINLTIVSAKKWEFGVIDSKGKVNRITMSPTTGNTGSTTVTITTNSRTETGIYDFYLISTTDDNATSFRVNVVNPSIA